MKKILQNKLFLAIAGIFALQMTASAQTSIADFDAAVYAQEIVDKLLSILGIIIPVVIAVLGLRIAIRWIKRWMAAA